MKMCLPPKRKTPRGPARTCAWEAPRGASSVIPDLLAPRAPLGWMWFRSGGYPACPPHRLLDVRGQRRNSVPGSGKLPMLERREGGVLRSLGLARAAVPPHPPPSPPRWHPPARRLRGA